MPAAHTHGRVSSIRERLQTNTPFLHIQVRSVSDNTAGTLRDVGEWGGFFSLGKEINNMCGFLSCFLGFLVA